MGRYVFFSTGFEYKFWFGVQSSSDILEFGGCLRNRRGEDGNIQWTFDLDYDYVVTQLPKLSTATKEDIDRYLNAFDKNKSGT